MPLFTDCVTLDTVFDLGLSLLIYKMGVIPNL